MAIAALILSILSFIVAGMAFIILRRAAAYQRMVMQSASVAIMRSSDAVNKYNQLINSLAKEEEGNYTEKIPTAVEI
jgi:hypothetical protein